MEKAEKLGKKIWNYSFSQNTTNKNVKKGTNMLHLYWLTWCNFMLISCVHQILLKYLNQII